MTATVLRVLERIQKANNPAQELHDQIAYYRGKHGRRRKALGLPGKTKAQRDREESAANRKVYAAVAARDTECQCGDVATFGPCDGPLHIDHQWGRGKAPTEEKNCRRLCTRHDQMKTGNEPSRKAWLVNFAVWAFGKRFFGEYEKAQRSIALEEGQHPQRAGRSET